MKEPRVGLPRDRYDAATVIPIEGRLPGDVIRDLNAWLQHAGIEFDENPFHDVSHLWGAYGVELSRRRWIVCHLVRGGSEGWYIHLASVSNPDPLATVAAMHAKRPTMGALYKLWGLCKTFDRDLGFRIVQEASRALDIA